MFAVSLWPSILFIAALNIMYKFLKADFFIESKTQPSKPLLSLGWGDNSILI